MSCWRRCLVRPEASIREALSAIDDAASQIALVVDGRDRLQGVVTDGDIRRGVLRGVDLEEEVAEVMNPEPTTVSPGCSRDEILALMKQQRLHQIPVVDEHGRVVELEAVDELLEPEKRDNPVVLMAGGLGTRLRPLTEDRPKPLVEVGDRPILETILLRLIDQGFHKFYITVNYKAEMIEEYFGDGSEWGVKIQYLREEKRLGTAGSLHLLPESVNQPFIVMNGDLLTKLNFTQLMEFHREHGALATMGVRKYDLQVPYGVVETDQFRIKDITEKPSRRYFINGGVYVLDPSVVDFMPDQQFLDMPELFQRLIESGHEAAVFPIHEYWQDVGRYEELTQAREGYADKFDG